MKRALLVLSLTLALVFAFSATAMAATFTGTYGGLKAYNVEKHSAVIVNHSSSSRTHPLFTTAGSQLTVYHNGKKLGSMSKLSSSQRAHFKNHRLSTVVTGGPFYDKCVRVTFSGNYKGNVPVLKFY